MDKYVDMLLNAIAFVGRPLIDAGRFLFNELGPLAWFVCAIIPVLAILGMSSLVKSRNRW